ncbi:Uncharacterised protein [Salmonella enterica subsp. enterica]|nr:Uncharacterised protein [Salmonella enterica subsp. enterica]
MLQQQSKSPNPNIILYIALTLTKEMFVNKTQWLFLCVISVTLLSSLITSADLNAAPLTGTMNYNERINPRPCVLHSNEQSQKLPDYSIADIIKAGEGSDKITKSSGQKLKGELEYTIGVDCPAEVSAVNVKALLYKRQFIWRVNQF